MPEERFVYKYVGPGEGPKRIFRVAWREFVFDPYEELSAGEHEMCKAYFERFSELFIRIPYEDYLAYLADAAQVRFCGDYGGMNAKGEFCGRRVDEGQRCEHHGEDGKQGPFEASGWDRPERLL